MSTVNTCNIKESPCSVCKEGLTKESLILNEVAGEGLSFFFLSFEGK